MPGPSELPKLLAAVHRLKPLVDASRDRFDTERQLPVELVDALKEARIFSMWVPRTLGGQELDPLSFLTVVEALARLDGSLGWCAVISAGYAWLSGMLNERFARDVFAGQAVLAGTLNPTGHAIRTDGGYRVSGRWSYGSFIGHSDWVLGNCITYEDDVPRTGSDGAPKYRLCLFPRQDVQIIDVWHVSGLRATGSNDYMVEDLFVPAAHTLEIPGFSPIPRDPGALYSVPMPSLFVTCIAVVVLGIARAALDDAHKIAQTKKAGGLSMLLSEKVVVQVDMARAEALLRSARAYLFDEVARLWECAQAGGRFSLEERAAVRLASSHATECAIEAVTLARGLVGGAALFEGSRLERCFRDINAAGQHLAIAATTNFELVGRALFGFEPGTSRF
jgi:alkylation response protein AidB-like acyl-CoA dehydrogenase